MDLILLILCSISITVASVSLIVVIIVLNKQKELLEFCKAQAVNSQKLYRQSIISAENNNVVQSKQQDLSSHGIIICKECYAPIRNTSSVCPHCKAAIVGR